MRDVALTLVILGLLPLILSAPYVGIYVWHWYSLMNPQRLTYGFAYSFPFAMIIAGVTITAWFFSSSPKKIPWSPPTVAIVVLGFWITLSTMGAVSPDASFPKWEQALKVFFMVLLTASLINTEKKLITLIWVAALSVGYYGFKGGAFAIVTGGQYRVWGPPESFFADNNAVGLALVMTIPLLRFLQLNARVSWMKLALLGGMGLTGVAVLATYSRGALLGLAVISVVLWLRSRHKLLTGTVAAIAIVASLSFLPDKWFGRMDTIQEYEEDASAMSRLAMWGMSLRLALDRPVLGGGFDVFKNPSIYPRYFPSASRVRDVHSIYFQMLGEHGFVGLGIFVSIILLSLREAQLVKRWVRERPDLRWANYMANCLQASILGYAVSGAFLTLAFFDLFYLIAILTVCLRAIVSRALADSTSAVGIADAAVAAPAAPLVTARSSGNSQLISRRQL